MFEDEQQDDYVMNMIKQRVHNKSKVSSENYEGGSKRASTQNVNEVSSSDDEKESK